MNPIVAIEPRPYLMVNQVQHYSWGTRGQDAFIPRLLGIDAEADCAYAELWMGTHPNAPSAVLPAGGPPVSLCELISRNPLAILGKAVADQFSGSLPFLFKILSAAKALSVQVHPDKQQARVLRARDPEHYPDDNHKPELAVALDSLTALAGFKSLAEVRQSLGAYPELAGFVGQDVCAELASGGTDGVEPAESIRLLFSALVKRSVAQPEALLRSLEQLEARLNRSTTRLGELDCLFLDLRAKYPGPDVGLFSIFLLNLVHLEKGQGLYLGAGIPHAYLQGNIVECMANSDNVVRLGLTPKFKDAEALIDVLDYEPGPLPILGGAPGAGDVVYQTPAKEFQVTWWRLGAGQEIAESANSGPQVLLVTEGQVAVRWGAGLESGVLPLQQGQSVLIPAILADYAVAARTTAELFRVAVPV